jgi:hypothetical protein
MRYPASEKLEEAAAKPPRPQPGLCARVAMDAGDLGA